MTKTISTDELPHIIKGKGFGIVEDCGGVRGLEEIAKGLKTGQVKDWENLKSWLDDICPAVSEKGLDFFDIYQLNSYIKKRYASRKRKNK